MVVRVYGETYQCAVAEKGADHVRLYDDTGTCVQNFSGISDFSGYEIEGGEWTDVTETPSQLDQIEAQVTYTAMMTDTLLEV